MSATYPYYQNTNYQTSGNDLSSILPVAYGYCNSDLTTTQLMNCTVQQSTVPTSGSAAYTITVTNTTNLKGIIVGSANNTGTNRGYTFSSASNSPSNQFQVVVYNGSGNATNNPFSFIIY